MESLGEADPESVGGYRLFARLGAGGMGRVYLARTTAGRPLALKTLRSEFALDSAFGERFAREIRHADRVRSPWSVTVVDYSPAGAHPQWLATEYVAAPSLAEWVAAHGPLPPECVTALAAELCEALHAVHHVGLSHRDVKPSNVLLADARPRLIDFGIARAAEDSRHTRTGGIIGSPGYMAPEQATAGGSAEPGDVFALAAVLVYAATGRGPFDRLGEQPSTPALLYRVVHEQPELDGVPDALLPLLRACLAKEPGDRPTARSAAALLPEPERAAGHWARRLPQGLAADLASREARTREVLTDRAAVMPEAEPGAAATTPATTPVAATPAATTTTPAAQDATGVLSGQSPYAVSGTARTGAASPVTGGAVPGTSAYGGGQVPVPAQAVPAPRTGGWASAPQPAPLMRPSGPTRRRTVLAAIGAAVVAAGVVISLVVTDPFGSHTNGAGTDGGTGTSSPPATGTGTGTAPDALPASWVGTWVGTGPGDPDGGSLSGSRTGTYTVTLTLSSGRIGQVVGQQVSDVRDLDTGANVGCTESLELRSVNGATLKFAATSAHTTDPSSRLVCPPGNAYEVTMSGGRLRLGSGSQSSGAPTTFTRK